MDTLLKLIAECGAFWTGTYQAHVTLHHIPKLWNLIKSSLAHKLSERSYTGIVVLSPLSTARLCVRIHTTKLINLKYPPIFSNTTL